MGAPLVTAGARIASLLLVMIGCGGSSAKAPAAAGVGASAREAPGTEAVAMPKPDPEEPVPAGQPPVNARPAQAIATPALRAAPTVYVEWHGTHRFAGLEVYVASIEEKRTTEGDELLKVELTLRAGDQARSAYFAGESERPETFAGYLVQFRGGSRQAVGLAVVRADAQ